MISNSVEDFSRIDLQVGGGGNEGVGSVIETGTKFSEKLQASQEPFTSVRSDEPIGDENHSTAEYE
jgi:hypothetical protein